MFKKNLKKLVAIALTVVALSSTMTVMGAGTVSKWIDSPALTAGILSQRTAAQEVYEAADTVHGQNCYAQFDETSFGTLQSNFSDSSRLIYVYLYDLDPEGDEDDHLKTYLGAFNARKLKHISVTTYSTSQTVEGIGDNRAELYIKVKLDKLSGDPISPTVASGLFRYRVGIQ